MPLTGEEIRNHPFVSELRSLVTDAIEDHVPPEVIITALGSSLPSVLCAYGASPAHIRTILAGIADECERAWSH